MIADTEQFFILLGDFFIFLLKYRWCHKIKLQKKNIELLKQEIDEKSNKLQNTIEQVNKLKIEIEIREKEISKTESVLDEINHELSQIKNNILTHNDE